MVNFCVAILILKMEENKQHFLNILLCYFKKGKNTTEIGKKTFVQCISARDFLLDNAPQLGRPVEVDSDHIKTLIENCQQ